MFCKLSIIKLQFSLLLFQLTALGLVIENYVRELNNNF